MKIHLSSKETAMEPINTNPPIKYTVGHALIMYSNEGLNTENVECAILVDKGPLILITYYNYVTIINLTDEGKGTLSKAIETALKPNGKNIEIEVPPLIIRNYCKNDENSEEGCRYGVVLIADGRGVSVEEHNAKRLIKELQQPPTIHNQA